MRRMIILGLRLERSLSNVSVSAVSDIAEVKETPGSDETMNKDKKVTKNNSPVVPFFSFIIVCSLPSAIISYFKDITVNKVSQKK